MLVLSETASEETAVFASDGDLVCSEDVVRV